MELEFSILLEIGPFLLRGAWVTVQLVVAVLIISTPLALVVALARDSRVTWLASSIAVLSWIFRGIPPLIILFLVYFAMPQFGVAIKPFPAAVIGMTLYMMFYFGECIRAGLTSVDPGQYQAAKSLGLPPFHTFRRIVLPQALPAVVPPYISHATEVVKGSSLCATIAVAELTGNAYQQIIATYRAFEILLFIGVVYVILDSSLLMFQVYAERRWTARSHR